MKKATITTFIFSLTFFCQVYAIESSKIDWHNHFGTTKDDNSTFYSLLSNSFFRANLSPEFTSVMNEWQKKHPKSQIIPITFIQPFNTKIPNSKLVIVWVADGEDILNIELVRRGCVAGNTMPVMESDKLEIPRERYIDVMKLIHEAEDKAKAEELGIWHKTTP